ncbi:hypothetical protein VitviT2T_001013 [Vitis vinifera]|uniref:DUF4283 domain-containing protein n=2 Tax=Vitis vinifera TaxID=29760 RepID=A0ABY9BEB2_VITVI|nr:hypothetical protein VitviT2T_001013 [Vitis vinifera]
MGERERAKAGERECDGEEGDEGSVPRRRRRECKFSVESKEFEIIGDERKGKFQALIVEKKGGVASWIRLGLDSLGLFLEGLNLCILDEKASGWGREWKEQGRTFSMSRGTNIAGEFIRLGVFDLARKHFCIFVPRGRKETRGWMTMADKIKEVIGAFGSKSKFQEGKSTGKIAGGSSYATIAKRALLGNPNAIAVKVRREESMGMLKKLDHCVVASRRGNAGEEDDLEKLGQHWAKSWELKGSLGLAKMEKGRVLLDFEDLEEARRAVFSGNRTMKGVQIGLEFWSPRSGCWTEEEKAKEIWWARILVRSRGDARPSVLEVEVEEEVYEIALWWECRPVIRRSSSQAESHYSSEVGGEVSSRAEKRVTKGMVSVRIEDLHSSGEGTGGQRAVGGLFVSNEGRGPISPSWIQPGAVHLSSPNASPKVLKRDGGPGLKIGARGLKMKGVALSPDAGPSGRPDEVGCSITGPVSTPIKGLSSKGNGPQPVRSSSAGQNHFLSQKSVSDPGKNQVPEPFVAWETEDLRKLNGVVRISETDKALEEESMRYGKGMWSWGNRVLGIPHLNSFNFDRTPGVESFGHSGDWNEGARVDNSMWLTVYEGGVERSNGCREVGVKESSSDTGRRTVGDGATYDSQTERGMQEDKWEESDLAKFSHFLGFPTEGLEKEILKFLSQIKKRREKIHSKELLEKSKFERELKRLECSINYEGGLKQKGSVQGKGRQIVIVQ